MFELCMGHRWWVLKELLQKITHLETQNKSYQDQIEHALIINQ
jgi:hypothetical protein